jgi:DoxX-like family
MNTAYVIVIVTTAIATAAVAVPDYNPARFVLANSAKVGVPLSWLPTLGTLKLAGAIGLIAGLLGLPAIGIAAGTGLALYFIGAVVVHLRARVFHNIAAPSSYLVLAIASLALMVAH